MELIYVNKIFSYKLLRKNFNLIRIVIRNYRKQQMLSILNTRGFKFISNFFFIVNPTQIFLADFCIRPDLFYSGYYSLILNIALISLKCSIYFQCHQLIEIITKSCTQHLQIYSLNSSEKNFFCFEYLFSCCINSLPWDFF